MYEEDTHVRQRQSRFLLAVTLAAIVGGAASAVVLAAIPDANGVIHGCYLSSGIFANGQTRIIDDGTASCRPNETPISWGQNGGGGGWKGYGYINVDGQLDTARSKNVVSVTKVQTDIYCVTTSVTPMLVSVSSYQAQQVGATVRGADSQANLDINSYCDPTANILIQGGSNIESQSSGNSSGIIYFFFL